MIPLSNDELNDFTPASLNNVAPKPVFRFRAATIRDQKRYGHALLTEGLRLFQEDQVHAEILRVLKANWSEETFSRESARLETHWAKLEQGLPIDPDEQAAIAELTMRCMDASELLRRMDADNRRFSDEAPGVALGMFLSGWKNLDVPFRMEGGHVPFETLDALQRELLKVETAAQEAKVEGVNPGLAYLQLSLHAFSLLNLNKDEEKNSDAPSQSSDTQSGSTTTTQKDGASESTSSAPVKTRRGKSPQSSKS